MRLKLFTKMYLFNIICIIILSILSVIYIYTFIKYDSIKRLIYKDTNTKGDLSSKLIYNSLNKVIPYDDIILDIDENDIAEKVSIVSIDIKVPNKKEEKPIIYIYNTHDSEKYSLPFVSDYSITPDVKLASYILKDHLNDFNIESKVEKRKIKDYLNKNKLDYSYSYQASRSYIKDELKKNDYKILIDLHRDSATKKYTTYEKDGEKYAKIMFVLGHDYKTYKKNEEFMNKLNNRINKEYKGLSRGIFVRKSSRYNQDLSNYAILIEVGGVDSTLEEINNTLYVFAKILSEYINEEIYGRK